MANTLTPSYSVISSLKTAIVNALATELPSDVRASMIAPLLLQINQWASQIPILVDSSGPPLYANIIFAIRKDLFISPLFTHCVLGIPMAELPPAFSEFLAFILKLIEAQKSDKDKSPPKVCFSSYLSKIFV